MEASRASTNDLAQACARSADAAEWAELLRRCTPLVSLVTIRVARMWSNEASPALVDDTVQEVFLKLCAQERRVLRAFQPRGEDSFLGLVRLVAASVANDHFRRLYSVKRGGKVVTDSLREGTLPALPEENWEPHRMQQSVMLAQLDAKMRKAPEWVCERDRIIFWLYYRQGFTAEEIAAIPTTGLTAKGVESALRRVTQWVRAEIERRRPGDRPGLPLK
jgi:RNA polymerase sigma-70 factor (ECF subfamily)